ncbi:Pentatricopeptide repeat [Macleaya cordata]|uniref:Pentatricopeptide repeat n=1 Tax=Macleaya cordata TaxID=56857 RepID=A0A200QSB2_MACCD|nr:Pentatricopeptide repeat [Macleaya cordata]
MILTANLIRRPKIKFWTALQWQKQFSISLDYYRKIIPLLQSCTKASEITKIHARMIKAGLDFIPFPISKLLAASILDIDYAASIFSQIQNPNLFMFNTMLRGYSISKTPKQSLLLFNTLRAKGILLDQFSFICTLKSCTRASAITAGEAIHGIIIQFGFELFINVRNSLLHFYCSWSKLEIAHQLFDEFLERDLVSWNTMMGGYLLISQPTAVLNLFREMHLSGLGGNSTTVLGVLSACADLRNLPAGESLHAYCLKNGFSLELNVITAIIDMYGKTGYIDNGRRIFDETPQKDVILWNCIIDGYVKNGLLEESFLLLRKMKLEQMKPNSATLAGLLSACASSGVLATGQFLHKYIEEEELLELDAVLGTALVDMYSKCGLIEKAVDVFDKMQSKDVKTWTAMITAYGVHGQAVNAIRHFQKMEEEGETPNGVTFLAVLNACSHGGLVMEGKNCFERMVDVYGFSPSVEHYGCMVDLLGRAGLLEEAHELLKSLPIETDATAWRALLAACRVYGNFELGETVKRRLVELNDKHPSDSILLSSTYAVAGRWDDVARMRESGEEKMGMKKEVGWSSIEMDA